MKVLKEDGGTLIIEVEDLTLANLINENLWKQKIDYAACNVAHPYLAKPVITVKAKNPAKAIKEAAEQALSDVQELKKKFAKI